MAAHLQGRVRSSSTFSQRGHAPDVAYVAKQAARAALNEEINHAQNLTGAATACTDGRYLSLRYVIEMCAC